MIRSFLILVFPVLFIGCQSNEVGNSNDVDPDSIWFDYKITGEEGNPDITVLLQYRYGGSNGTTLLLVEPSMVKVDGVALKGDSSRMTGAFYELIRPVSQFMGKHEILFTDLNEKDYREIFYFQPMYLLTDLPDTIQRTDLYFELQGLEEEDFVRVLLTDTSFTSPGINRLESVKNGKLTIKKTDLEKLVNGPIHLELIKENEKKVKAATNEGGRIAINYGLRRSFLLRD
jgi:hypothetical protein